MLYRQLYIVAKGVKTANFHFLNQINVLNVEVFVLHLKYYEKAR